MPDIKKLTDKSNVEFYPRTVMDAVYDSQTGRTLSNGVPASRYRTFTANNPVADTSIDGFEYSQTFDWDNVLATDEASADIVSGYSSDYSVGVETLQDSIKLYFDEDPTDAVIRVILYPARIGNLPSDTVATELEGRITTLEGKELKVLWENPNSSVVFTAQTIALSSSDYDYLIMEGKFHTGTNMWFSTTVSKGNSICLSASEMGSNYVRIVTRRVNYISDTLLEVGVGKAAYFTSSSQMSEDNGYCIPTKVYGGRL